MGDLAFEEIAYRGEADVRMWPDIDALGEARLERRWAEMIEEDERPHHPPRDLRQGAADLEAAAEIVPLGVEDEFDQGQAPGTRQPDDTVRARR